MAEWRGRAIAGVHHENPANRHASRARVERARGSGGQPPPPPPPTPQPPHSLTKHDVKRDSAKNGCSYSQRTLEYHLKRPVAERRGSPGHPSPTTTTTITTTALTRKKAPQLPAGSLLFRWGKASRPRAPDAVSSSGTTTMLKQKLMPSLSR